MYLMRYMITMKEWRHTMSAFLHGYPLLWNPEVLNRLFIYKKYFGVPETPKHVESNQGDRQL